jgi:hypothetical protein
MIGNPLPQIRRVAAVSALCLVPALAAAAPPESPACVPPGKNARITWRGSSAAGARLYFRSDNARTEHYVEMRRGPGRFSGLLPKIASAASIFYRIVTPDAEGGYTMRSNGTIAVLADCATQDLTAEDQASTNALVLGLTEEGPSVPVGFACEGIIGRIGIDGQLRAHDACAGLASAAVGITRNSFPNRTETGDKTLAADAQALGVGVITPDHHRRPRRAPVPPTPPNPRVVEPVSPARP